MGRVCAELWFKPVILLAGLVAVAGACVTAVQSHQVEISVVAPCEYWPEETAGSSFQIEVFRAYSKVGGRFVEGDTECQTEILASVACDVPVVQSAKFGDLPEAIGVRVTASSGVLGYAIEEIYAAGKLNVLIAPALNEWELKDEVDFCRPVSNCLFGEAMADEYCKGIEYPFPTPPDVPVESPTAVPSDPDTTPSSGASPPPARISDPSNR